MTYTAAPACPARYPAGSPGACEAAEFAVSQSFTAQVSDGLTGATRVMMMLHSRRYRVTSLNVEIREGTADTRVSCTVSLPEVETGLLVARLMRMPAVISATHAALRPG